MATITSLGFSIFSTYNGRGTNEASRALRDLDGNLQRATGGLNSFTGRMAAAATGAAALGPALLPIGAAATAGAASLASFGVVAGTSMGIYGAAMKGAIERTMEMAEANKKLAPSQKEFVGATKEMNAAWEQFIVATQDKTLSTATLGVQGMTNVIKALAPVVDAIHPAILKAAQAWKDWTERADGLQRFVDILEKHAAPAVDALLTAGRDMLAVLGEGFRAFVPYVQDVAEWIKRGAAALRDWAEGGGFQRFIQYIKDNGPALQEFWAEFKEALATIAGTIKELGPFALGLVTILLKLVNALPPEYLDEVVKAFLALKAAMLLVNIALGVTALLASPLIIAFGLIIAVVAALGIVVFLLITRWNEFATYISTSFMNAVNMAWQGLQQFWDWITGFFVTVWHTVRDALTQVGLWFANLGITIANWVVSTALAIAGWVVNTALAFAGWVVQIATIIGGWVVNTVLAFTGWVVQIATIIGGWVVNTVLAFTGWVVQIATIIGGWVVQTATAFAGWVVQVVQAIAGWVVQTATAFAGWVVQIVGIIAGWVTQTAAAFAGWVVQVVQAIAGWVAETAAAFAGWVADTASAFAGWVADTASAFAGWVANVVGIIAGWVASTAAAFAGWVAQTVSAFAGWVAQTVSAFAGWVASVVSAFAGWIAQTASAFAGWIADTASAFAGWIADTVSAFAGWIADTVSAFAGWVADTAQAFADWVADVIQAFVDWAADVLETVGNWVTDTLEAFANWATDMLEALGNWIRDTLEDIGTWAADMITAFVDMWEQIVADIGEWLGNRALDAVETAINALLTPINLLIDGFNAIAGVFGIPDVPNISVNFAYGGIVGKVPGFADGGVINFAAGGAVPGYAPGRDKVPAMLSPGEGVLVPEAVRGLGGAGFVNAANNHFSNGRTASATGRHGNWNSYSNALGMQGGELRQLENAAHPAGFADGGMVPGLIQAFAMGGITLAAIARAGGSGWPITQPEYNPGVAASAGTHDRGGVVDFPPNPAILSALLATGEWAAWMRGNGDGMVPHIHAVLMSHPDLSPAAAAQVQSFLAGGNGLGVGGGGGNPFLAMIGAEQIRSFLRGVIELNPVSDVLGEIFGGLFGGGSSNDDGGGLFGTGIGPDVGPDITPGDGIGDVIGGVAGTLTGGLVGQGGGLPGPAADATGASDAIQGMGGMIVQMIFSMLGMDDLDFGFGLREEALDGAGLGGNMFEDILKSMGTGGGGHPGTLGGAKEFIFDQKPAMPTFAAGGAGGGAGVEQWRALALQAMMLGGLNPNQIEAFLALMAAESGGNPMAINMTDINAQNGVPSQGLMQVIPPTFAAFHVPGTSSNILDPLANMAAAAAYIASRYGGQVPGSPYGLGTRGAKRGWHLVGEFGPEWTKFRGGEKVLPNGETPPLRDREPSVVFNKDAIKIDARGASEAAIRRLEEHTLPKMRMMLQQKAGRWT